LKRLVQRDAEQRVHADDWRRHADRATLSPRRGTGQRQRGRRLARARSSTRLRCRAQSH
jgi:hypothetical protein